MIVASLLSPKLYVLDLATSISPQIVTSINIMTRASAICNMGSFNYILAAISGSTNAKIYFKRGLVENIYILSLCNPQMSSGCTANDYALVQGLEFGDQVDFVYQSASGNLALTSIKPAVSSCSVAFVNGVCQNCASGYYYVSKYNRCYMPADLPEGLGPSISSSPAVASLCVVSSCKLCRSNKDACDLCPFGLFYKPDNAACTTNTYVGYGFDTSSPKRIIKCLDQRCSDCFSLQSNCLRCLVSFAFLSNNRTAGC